MDHFLLMVKYLPLVSPISNIFYTKFFYFHLKSMKVYIQQ